MRNGACLTDQAGNALVAAVTQARIIRLTRKLALILALAAHLVGPTAANAASGFDPASAICAPSGKVSAEAEAAIQELLRLAGVEEEENAPADGSHCGACVMMCGALAAQPEISLIQNAVKERRIAFAALRQTVPSVHGPPLGLRAPPA